MCLEPHHERIVLHFDASVIEAPASFTIETTGPETQGFLHGFLYLAENGGIVKIGDGANTVLGGPENMRAEIGGNFINGFVNVNSQGEKTAFMTGNLPGLPGGAVESINHLFHFVVPISDGDGIAMLAQINDFGGRATTQLSGDFAIVQWRFKATAWAYATTEMPSIELNTLVRLLGDFNGDGVVDAADYTVWRNSLGQVGSGLAADADGNNVVDEYDYLVWKLTYGLVVDPPLGSSGLAEIVPEPSSLFLWMIASLWSWTRASRR